MVYFIYKDILSCGGELMMMPSSVNSSGVLIYLIADLSCIFLMLPVLMNLKTSAGSEKEALCLKEMIWSFFVYIICDLLMVFFLFEQKVFPIWLCNVITVADELSILLVGYFWLQFGMERLSFRYEYVTWFQILVAAPLWICTVLSILSPFFGLFFHINEAGMYLRGPLFFIEAAVIMLYNISVPCISFYVLGHTSSASQRRKASSLIKFVIAPLLTGIVQLFTPNTPIMCLGLVIGFYFVYIDTVNMQIYNDGLTGLNNRRRAEYYLQECIDDASPEKPFYLFMIDIDDFKEINDTYGHVEGDHALKTVAESLKQTADQNHGFAARIGGDEFLLSTYNEADCNPEKIKTDLMDNLTAMCRQNKLPYMLKMSVGYTRCDSKQLKPVELLDQADQMQYRTKNAHHAATGKHR
jgi:diguanylate cyclase (GGDEF)-like protein